MNRRNISLILTMILLIVVNQGCQETKDKNRSVDPSQIFPKGRLAPAEFFTGNAWLIGLVDNDSVFTTTAGNVFFEAGAPSNWHLHPCGQILLVTSGVGYHQIKGQPIEIIRKGNVVKCPPNVEHWHGGFQRHQHVSYIHSAKYRERYGRMEKACHGCRI